MIFLKHSAVRLFCVLAGLALSSLAAPFAQKIDFVQPDGTAIKLWGEGDEFYAVFETLDGYTVVFDEATKAYVYATAAADGSELVPTDLAVGTGDPAQRGLTKHVRLSQQAIQLQARERFLRWDRGMEVTRRWKESKELRQTIETTLADGPVMAPPSFTTTDQKMGLTLLIDFDNDPQSIPQAAIVDFCNSDNYTGFGNNGSVKKFFQDNSNGLLTYSNTVTAYIRIPNSLHPKSWYNDTSKSEGTQGNLLVRDALGILTNLPNYATEILPTFANLTVDGEGYIEACNVFYAGDNGGVWARGLWPHSWGLYVVGAQTISPDGMKVFKYQMTNIGNSLTIGTFCHENGHMLCGFPDIYDYQYDSVGGAGLFCIMNSGGHGTNPSQFCAYLKYVAGWSTTVELTDKSALTATSISTPYAEGFNRFYRYEKPSTATEYFLFENRQQVGRDAQLPAAGIAIWHVDELGDRDNQSLTYNTAHDNYECTLVQADNQWHFQSRANSGDANDLYYQGNPSATYTGTFNDSTKPAARWWDGTKSKLEVSDFSGSGPIMTYSIGARAPLMVVTGEIPSGRVGTPYSFLIGAVNGVEPYVWTFLDGTLPSGITFEGNGCLSGVPEEAVTAEFRLVVAGDNGLATTNQFSLRIKPVMTAPFVETFENGGQMPDGWWQEYVQGECNWNYNSGSPQGHPENAYSNQYNAILSVETHTQLVTRLISPRIDFGGNARAARLTFWHHMEEWIDGQDVLRVYYKENVGDAWSLVQTFATSVSGWTEQTVDLPVPARSCYVAFEGEANYGYGICIDEVRIFDPTPPLGITTADPLPSATTEQPYSLTLEAEGGTGLYTFGIFSGGLPIDFSLSTNGVISGMSSNVQHTTFTVLLTDSLGETAFKTFNFSVALPSADLYAESFDTLEYVEPAGYMPKGWTFEYVTNTVNWTFRSGAPFGHPSAPTSGINNACFFSSALVNGQSFDQKTKLVSPLIELGPVPSEIKLTFWHHMESWEGDQDQLRVYYRTATNTPWLLLPDATYVTSVSSWTQRSIMMPVLSHTYQLGFEGNARYGYGVCLDDVRLTDATAAPVITAGATLPTGVVTVPYSTVLAVSGGVVPYAWSVVSGSLPPGLELDGAAGAISGVPTTAGLSVFSVKVAGADGKANTNQFSLRITNARPIPFVETFESGGSMPAGWSQEYTLGSVNWTFRSGSPVSPGGVPVSAHSNSQYNACLYYEGNAHISRLISPMLNLGSGTNAQARLTFWHCMANYYGDQDQLQVLYRNSSTSNWEVLSIYDQEVPGWTEQTIDLPNPSSTYYIAFEGWAIYGYGVCIDDVTVTGNSTLSPYEAWKVDMFGTEADNASVSGDTADPDGDGIANALEYAMGLDPMTPDTEGLPSGGVLSGYLTLTFRMDKAAYDSGVIYEVEACTNLLDHAWTTNDVSALLPLADSNTWWQALYQHNVPTTNAPQRFLRLKVTLP